MAKVEWTPEQLEELDKIRNAMRGEFEASELNKGTRASAIEDMDDLKPTFLKTIKHVCEHSQNEALKAKVAMWGMDKLTEKDAADNDPLAVLMEAVVGAKTAEDA